MDKIYFVLFHIFRFLVTFIPRALLDPLLVFIADIVRLCDSKHRFIMMTNLNLAYEDTLSLAQKKAIIKEVYRNLAFNGADFVRNYPTTKEAILKKVRFENEDIMQQALESKRPIVFQTGHYGNWELVSLALAARYGALSGIGRPLDSPMMNHIVRQNREQLDIELIDKKGAMRPMLKAVKEGRNIGLLVDQNTSRRAGIIVKFFGKDVRHTPAASIMARRVSGLIVPVFISTDDHKVYTLTFYDPIEVANTENMEHDILEATQAQANVMEAVIRAKPEEWFWFHRRWKGEHKSAYGIRKRRKRDV
ncbi:lipid A biosynthesis lauroyl acyltransferase [Sulfurospirillum barnesii]|nr:lipid A biosynthesis lauroyl acyltransferase [Sulfurospirillum barnesii]